MSDRQSTGVRNYRIHGLKTAQAGLTHYGNDVAHEPFHQSRFGSQSRSSEAPPRSLTAADIFNVLARPKGRGQPRIEVVTSSPPAVQPEVFPIHQYKDAIQKAIKSSSVTIIKGETGCGKSLYVPEFVAELGYRVISMQPRRVLVESLAARRAELSSTNVGERVGFQHSKAIMRSPETEILYITYGTQFVKELMGYGAGKNCVYIFDEKHEQKIEMDLLLGLLLKRGRESGHRPKIVIMSATLDTEKLKSRFPKAPLIEVPGRRFPITHIEPKDTLVEDIAAAVARGKTPLCFLYGKRPIQETIAEIQSKVPGITALPFHSHLSRAELRRPFQEFSGPTVIVSTDMAESGLSMKNVNCVIMSGYARVPALIDGVESLVVQEATEFNLHQEESRGNRFGEGESIYRGRKREEIIQMPAPEIQSKRIDAEYLKLVAGGEDFRTIVKYAENKPRESQIVDAERRLRTLNLITTSRNIEATPDGLYVASLPISPSNGKIIALARKLDQGVGRLTSAAIDVVSVIEAEGIISKVTEEARRAIGDFGNSEPLGQAKLLAIGVKAGFGMAAHYGLQTTKMLRALEVRQTLRERLGLDEGDVTHEREYDVESRAAKTSGDFAVEQLTAEEQMSLLRCIWKAQIGSLFRQVAGGSRHRGKRDSRKSRSEKGKAGGGDHNDHQYKQLKHRDQKKNPRGVRQLSNDVLCQPSRFMVGEPFNLGEIDSRGQQELSRLLIMPSAVPKKWLKDNIPPEFKTSLDTAFLIYRRAHTRDKQHERNHETHRSRGRRR